MNIRDYLARAIEKGASDLHLATANPPIIRVDGEMTAIGDTALADKDIRDMVLPLMDDGHRATFEAEKDVDFTVDFDDNTRFRVNLFNNREGAAVVFRTIPTKILTLDDLGAPKILRNLAELERGMVLVTGPTGSGKSTTLAAMIDHVNSNFRRHILTIEDPVEFVHPVKKSLINQREIGHDAKSFARALRSALREDPDVILVGEMRDYETISLALTAAETGHLVMGTLHSSSAAKTVARVLDVFPAGDKPMATAMLAGSLQAVIAQSLLRKADGKGRVAAMEILIGTPAVRNLVREGKMPQIYSMMQMGAEFGMQTMQDAVDRFVADGVVSEAEARACLAQAADAEEPDDGSAPKPPRSKNVRQF